MSPQTGQAKTGCCKQHLEGGREIDLQPCYSAYPKASRAADLAGEQSKEQLQRVDPPCARVQKRKHQACGELAQTQEGVLPEYQPE
mgnify:CR=1 FL=1